ncbi:bpX6 domain-containing protein [Janthinobacterium fluminis]|uniref:BpX6 domain-containing protein n=1 Tax=Janthinobacterium fluminis TaxID=2987524 RepID=A0ABT5K075_9BURK|nr:bpX6 domain-containing protein [Janthinobacterium fluminis]MDC8757855.1 bpX6 domain-containing protein [Janthinobacterium fluminis]
MSHKVRRPLYDGMQMVHALWFDLALIGETEARRRVLRHWAPGARLHLVQDGFLLMLATPRYGHCATLDGLPLCEQAGILSSAPLALDERAATPPASVWLVRAAQAQLISLTAAPRIDPAAWLDLRAIPLHAALQPPRLATAATAGAAPLEATPVREIFSGTIPPPSIRRDAFLKQMNQAQRNEGTALRGAAVALAFVGLAAALLGAVPLGLLRIFGKATGQPAQQEGTYRQRQKPSGPSALAQRLSALATRLAIFTRASKIIGWRQAAYLRKMMSLLEKGDMQDALRYAIPLDSLSKMNRPAFGAPRPRSSLEIASPHQATASIMMGSDLEQYLRSTYRRTFERLDREGKIDEATFVLAELLKCGGEAVDYLERKGRIKQAAQLAETMELAPEIAVRLWCMAGDVERAVQLARLGQAFAAAVQLLERHQSPQAAAMRLLWAEDLALRGHLSEAADAIWPLADHRDKALTWLLEGERCGGTLGLRALVKKLALLPDSLAESESDVLQLLDGDDEHDVQQRTRLGMELLAIANHSPATKRVASELMRPLLADRMAGRTQFDKKSLTQLLALSDSDVLKADLPQLNMPAMASPRALAARAEVLRVHLAEHGLLTLHDARRLPDGHYLLALGEGGVIRVDRHGRQLAQFPVPATRLVVAAGGQRALALVQRDSMWRVSRIDLIARKVSDWIIQPLRFWARQYDGLIWNAVIENRLVAIDTSKDQLTVSWQVADLPGEIVAFLEEQGAQTLLLSTAEEIQQWRYQLPGRRLMQRDSFPHPREQVWQLLLDNTRDAPTVLRLLSKELNCSLQVHNGSATASFEIPLKAIADTPEVVLSEGLMLIRNYPDDLDTLQCLVVDARTGKVLADLSLAECNLARAHLDHGHILLFDQAGRLIDINCEDSQVHTLTLA